MWIRSSMQRRFQGIIMTQPTFRKGPGGGWSSFLYCSWSVAVLYVSTSCLRMSMAFVVGPFQQQRCLYHSSIVLSSSFLDNDSIMPPPAESSSTLIPKDVVLPMTTTTPPNILGSLASTFTTSTTTDKKNGRMISTDKSLRVKLGLVPVEQAFINESCASASSSRVVSTFIPELPTTVVGHRGALYQYLENTREGFLHCAQLGCHAIELDVFVLKDGHVVVFHGGGTDEHPGDVSEYCLFMDNVVDHEKDDTKQPPPPPKRNIMDMTYEETQQLQFNPDFAEFACDPELIRQARIPLLEHVLQDLMPYPDLEIKIELKGPGVVQPVLELVERYQMQHRCSYSSFQLDMLAELRTLRPDPRLYPTGALFTIPPPDYIERAMHVGATEIHIRYDQCHVDIIKTIHQAGFRSMAWMRGPIGMAHDVEHAYHDIENEEGWECYRCLLETGVQQICCNKPDVLLQLLSSLALLREDNIMDPLSPQLQLESVSSWEEENSSISECL